jgi:sugar O-acyltransferase (sialic acid O-acetyltransferase NeuD family)
MNDEKKLYLLGVGGHGRVVLDALLCMGSRVSGILDPGIPVGKLIRGVTVLGGDALLDGIEAANSGLALGIGVGSGRASRAELYEVYRKRGFEFVCIKHPSAIVSIDNVFEQGCQIMAGAVVQSGTRMGRNIVVNTRATIDHDCQIEDHVFISPGATLCGGVTVETCAFIGAGAVLLPGIRVGRNAIVGAGAIVVRDILPGTTMVGNPARKMERSFRE